MILQSGDIPVIVCTGFSEQITDDKTRKMDIRKHILKPIVMNKLAHTVREVPDINHQSYGI